MSTDDIPEREEIFLAINAGSSSVKFALYRGRDLVRIVSGKADRIGLPGATFTATITRDADEEQISFPVDIPGHPYVASLLMKFLSEQIPNGALRGVGHRVAHGMSFHEHVRVTPQVITELHRISRFAPEHLPQEIALIEEFSLRFPALLQVACFDTVFHQTIPRTATLLPLPRTLEEKGIRRYGFHGLSCEYVRDQLRTCIEGDRSLGRVIVLHLGSGASVTALKGGVSIDTSMGFTPLGGIPMSTRPGDLDPGVVLALPEFLGVSFDELRDVLNRSSGLLGVSGTSPHMRDLLDNETADPRAHDAVELFCYQVKKFIGAYVAVLGGVDTIVFTGGVGENAPEVRSRICEGLSFLGVALEDAANQKNARTISTPHTPVTVMVIRTDEEFVIAQTVRNFSGIL